MNQAALSLWAQLFVLSFAFHQQGIPVSEVGGSDKLMSWQCDLEPEHFSRVAGEPPFHVARANLLT